MIDTPNLAVRRASRAAALGLFAATLALAGPAGAVPEGWSDPQEVDPLFALGLLVGAPLGLFLLITFLVYVPSLVRGAKEMAEGPDHEWFGGPRKAMDELAGPDTEESKAGGASARW